jgi:hypothetical protein
MTRRAGHRRYYGAYALHAGYVRLQTHTHTLKIGNTYCFSTSTMAARTSLNITFIRTGRIFFLCSFYSYFLFYYTLLQLLLYLLFISSLPPHLRCFSCALPSPFSFFIHLLNSFISFVSLFLLM